MNAALRHILTKLRELRARYRECHQSGMAALERHDLVALDKAIYRETVILKEQQAILAEWRHLSAVRQRGLSP